MIAKRVTRYYAECGRGFWKKETAIKHDSNCKCWKNPKYKTCLSCKFKCFGSDSNGMEHEPHLLEAWQVNKCTNPKMDMDTMFTPAHKNAEILNINCPVWESK